jgi:hypothetical protein
VDQRKISFLQAVIGDDGARALTKATSASTDLEWAIFPRVVMSWLEVVSHGAYNSALPGTNDVKLTLRKGADDAFFGSVNIGDELYAFRDTTLYHVAGAVAVALGAAPTNAPELRHPSLAKLGKSVDLLVRSRTLRKMQQKHAGGAKGNLPGTAAAPRAPQGPVGPVAVQPTQPSQVGTKVATAMKPAKTNATPGATPSAAPKLPGVKPPKKPTLKVGKSEAATRCGACGGSQFEASSYVGCLCFAELAKSVRTTVVGNCYLLEFGSGWDIESITTLAETLGK